ncbi:MAG: hypothetical protein LH606_00020 [Cytophagaceae bacterium]|nr:hypothetical protein [Cytophagaceae bacterium]
MACPLTGHSIFPELPGDLWSVRGQTTVWEQLTCHRGLSGDRPRWWRSFAFKIRFRGNLLNVKATQSEVTIENLSAQPVSIFVYGQGVTIEGNAAKVTLVG